MDAVQHAIDQIKGSGKDVAALQAELDGLKPQWETIHAKQLDLAAMVEAFRPKMEALMHKVKPASGSADGGGNEPPIQGIQRGLDTLRSKGKDVTRLQTELDGLNPDWAAIQAIKAQIEKSVTPDQREKGKELEQKVAAFRPKVESLVKKVQELASTLSASRTPKR